MGQKLYVLSGKRGRGFIKKTVGELVKVELCNTVDRRNTTKETFNVK